ncbi:sodium-coupled monocarboxylate transporter 1 [Elysia marginata]|uniref:Sodium-coupled monocarboxylate transporter 1 n=1 Tax=Elysia marginata TaxID=1093978 RepID=A0AAV4JEY2_9GAST|nr:sodium-coupled monocarboxylate transporter 1 [Elysia marginata]
MSSQEGQLHFGTMDYIFLGLMLIGSMAIGLFFAFTGNSKKTQEEYLLGGRRLTAIPVCLSLFATFQSAISLLGTPTEIYIYGTMFAYGIIGNICSYFLALVTIVPLMYPLRLTSVYEYLGMRYESKTIQFLGAILGVISTLSYMMVALLSPALALETAVGIPLWLSIILVGVVGTVYTTLGGMKSVIWTDVFQTFVIFAGIFTVIIKGTMDAGGIDKVWQISQNSGRIIFDETSFDPRVRHTVWNQIIAVAIYWLATHFGQSSVQRLSSTRSIQDAYKVYIYTLPLCAIYGAVLTITGLVIVAYFFSLRCDPLAAGYIQNKNQIVPYFVLHSMSFLPGFSGLYIATIFSGALSTLSSGISSLAANVVEDILAGRLRNISEAATTTITKLLVCFFGIAVIGLAYIAKDFQGPIYQMTYTVVGATIGPILGVFMLGGLFPHANYVGAIFGCIAALIISFWQSIGAIMFGHPTKILPLGPTDHCLVENITTSVQTVGYTFVTGVTEAYNSSTDFTATTRYNINEQPANFTSIQERRFSFYDISYTWNPVMGMLITVAVGLTISIATNQFLPKRPHPKAKFLFPFCRRFWYAEMDVINTEIQHRDGDTKF